MSFTAIASLPEYGIASGSDIESVHFNDGILTLVLACSRDQNDNIKGVSLTFSDVSGFRFLDELDLARYWRSGDFPLGSHLLEVTEGGWSAEENEQQGLDCSRREWLAVTGNACVSVFCHAKPEVRDCSWVYQPD